jgi:hypothetical protein
VLDAMLGVVNLEQNNIIKLFAVMAVVLMPPTLIASIYGMNFKIMPELLAAAGPYVFFKWKKWQGHSIPRRSVASERDENSASISPVKFERWAERLCDGFLR